MAKKSNKKVTIVHTYQRHTPVTDKHPDGKTIVHEHLRRLPGSFMSGNDILNEIKNYPKTGIKYPNPNSLGLPDGNKYDELIAKWTDYFNKKFNSNPPLDPDIIKALIASESGFGKKETAASKLGRAPTTEELILEYKGLLKSKSDYKSQALMSFKRYYGILKKS